MRHTKSPELVEEKYYVGMTYGRKIDLYIAQKPVGKSFLGLFNMDGLYMPTDFMEWWTDDISKLQDTIDAYYEAKQKHAAEVDQRLSKKKKR
jgi:hypothetical protein